MKWFGVLLCVVRKSVLHFTVTLIYQPEDVHTEGWVYSCKLLPFSTAFLRRHAGQVRCVQRVQPSAEHLFRCHENSRVLCMRDRELDLLSHRLIITRVYRRLIDGTSVQPRCQITWKCYFA